MIRKLLAILTIGLCTSVYAEEKEAATHSWSPTLYEAINLVGKKDVVEIDFPRDNYLAFSFTEDSTTLLNIKDNPEQYHTTLSSSHEGKITAKIDLLKFKQMTAYQLTSTSEKSDKKEMKPTITFQFVPGFVQRVYFTFSDYSTEIHDSPPESILHILDALNTSLESNGFEKTIMGKVNTFINNYITDTLISREYYKDDTFVKVIYTDTGFLAIQVYTKEAERAFMKNYPGMKVNKSDLDSFLSIK